MLDDIDHEVRTIGMKANRRPELPPLATHSRIVRKQPEEGVEAVVILISLSGAEFEKTVDIEANDVALGLFAEPKGHGLALQPEPLREPALEVLPSTCRRCRSLTLHR